MEAPKKLVGVVGHTENGIHYPVRCAGNIPQHLKLIYLEKWAIRSAKPSDEVELEYRKTGRGYEWVVTQVFA